MAPTADAKYTLVAQKIQDYIRTQNFGPESRLPSERFFGAMINVSQATVNKAVTCLVGEGYLRRDGRKLFVAPPSIDSSPLFVLAHHPVHSECGLIRHDLLEAATVACASSHTRIIPLLARYNEEQFQQLVSLLKERPSRMVLWPMPNPIMGSVLSDLARRGSKIIVCDQEIGSLSHVCTDNRHGCKLAIDHLSGLGHRQLAYITIPRNNMALRERSMAYKYICYTNGLARSVARIVEIKNTRPETLAAALAGIRRNSLDVTGILCSNDRVALSLLEVMRRQGLNVPGDYSVVGFDDIDDAAKSRPGLTTIAQDFYQQGLLAVERLLAPAVTMPGPPMNWRIRFEPRLVIRGSTAAPRK